MATVRLSSPKVTDAQVLDWLATVPGYIEGATETNGAPTVLGDFQRSIINDPSRFVLCIKSRQTGFSFACAARALAKSQLQPGYTCIFVSFNLKDAKEKIRYARELYETIPKPLREPLERNNVMELEFTNGSRIVSEFMPRGKGPGDVVIDEMAHMARARDIYRAALPVISRGGQIIVGSTPLGKTGLFWDIVERRDGRYTEFSRHDIYWWDSPYLCIDVERARRAAPDMPTAERIDRFGTPALKEIFFNMLEEDFRQEFEIEPQDERTAFIPLDAILAVTDPELQVYDDFDSLKRKTRGILYGGYDVGRRVNASEFVLLELLGDKFYQRMLVTARNESFEAQKVRLRQALTVLPIARLCIDETGLGMNLAEDLSREFGEVVEPVNFASRVEAGLPTDRKTTVAVKERMATTVKITIENHGITLYPDRDLVHQIHSIKKITSATGNVRYDTERNEKHHADKFWALALALFAADPRRVSDVVLVPPVFPKVRG